MTLRSSPTSSESWSSSSSSDSDDSLPSSESSWSLAGSSWGILPIGCKSLAMFSTKFNYNYKWVNVEDYVAQLFNLHNSVVPVQLHYK